MSLVLMVVSCLGISISGCSISENINAVKIGLYYGEGQAALLKGDYKTAEAQFNQGLGLHKDADGQCIKSELLASLGDVYARQGRYPEAQTKLDAAIKAIDSTSTDPETPYAQACIATSLGILYAKQKRNSESMSQFDSATSLFEKYFSSEPRARGSNKDKQAECLRQYADLLTSMQQLDKAKELNAKAEKIQAGIY